MSMVPEACGGAVAWISVSERTVKLAAAVAPNETPVAPVKLVPDTYATVPPPVLPDDGVTAVTVGLDAALTVIWSDDDVLDVPEGVVTVMWFVAAACGGEIARIDVSERIVK